MEQEYRSAPQAKAGAWRSASRRSAPGRAGPDQSGDRARAPPAPAPAPPGRGRSPPRAWRPTASTRSRNRSRAAAQGMHAARSGLALATRELAPDLAHGVAMLGDEHREQVEEDLAVAAQTLRGALAVEAGNDRKTRDLGRLRCAGAGVCRRCGWCAGSRRWQGSEAWVRWAPARAGARFLRRSPATGVQYSRTAA